MRNQNCLEFRFPVDGDVLIGAADGTVSADGLHIRAEVSAPDAARLTIGGTAAEKRADGLFCAEVVLPGRTNVLEAADPDTGARRSITVYHCPEAYHTYRFTVDDCIRAFENLHRKRASYTSVFDDPFFAVFREAHERYASCVHINVFYATDDGSFDLSMMTEQYREELDANADWMTFSFHAMREHPDFPYAHADARRVAADAEKVQRELVRIAGRAAVRDTTTVHWGAMTREGARALRRSGCRSLCGYFLFSRGEPCYDGCYAPGERIVSYYLDDAQVENLSGRCLWVDTQEKLLFARLHMVLNAAELSAQRVGAYLDALSQDPAASAMIQMVIHEQHFYPDYAGYAPDYAERIWNMAQWMRENGYRPGALPVLQTE